MTLASSVLRRAREILTERGWTQGSVAMLSHEDPSKPCCLGVAVQIAEKELGSGANEEVCAAIGKALKLRGDPGSVFAGFDAVTWNDRPGRTAAEVLSALAVAESLAAVAEEARP